MRKMMIAAVAALATISTAAMASVTYDETGHGFVGKGDVQVAYGWNNATMQKNHTSVTFYFENSARYAVVCEWTTVTGGKNSKIIEHDVTKKYTLSSIAAVDSTSRKTGQYTGWFLNGFSGDAPTSSDLPALGSGCPQGGTASNNDPVANDAVVTDAYYLSDPVNALFASFGGVDHELPLTPVVVTTTTL